MSQRGSGEDSTGQTAATHLVLETPCLLVRRNLSGLTLERTVEDILKFSVKTMVWTSL